MKYEKGDYFLDRDTHELYIFDGNEWWKIIPSCYLKKPDYTKL
jgi:hypothetical protein